MERTTTQLKSIAGANSRRFINAFCDVYIQSCGPNVFGEESTTV
ncbi:MAG TPA: hypothetical protein VIF64_17900 [Pyrinomonadaceae bacterium]